MNIIINKDMNFLIYLLQIEQWKKSINNENNLYLTLELDYLSDAIFKLFDNSEFSDIDIQIGNKLIKAPKAILAKRNKVFKEMIIHALESKNVLIIEDFDFETAEAFVKYLYCGKILKKT